MNEQISEINCEQCRNLLSDYVDRELSDSEKALVERHLGSCNKCGSESSRMMGLKKIVQHWDGVKGSGEFRKSVMDKMIRESQQVPSLQFTQAAAKAAGVMDMNHAGTLGDDDVKSLPPVWILLTAMILAVAAYFAVLWLRGA